MSSPVSSDGEFTGRLGIQQRVLPAYRARFFDLLAGHCAEGLGVYSGCPLESEEISLAPMEKGKHIQASNWNFLDPSSGLYLCWQPGVLGWLEDWDPRVLIVEANPRILSTWRAVDWMHARGRPVIGWGLGAGRAAKRLGHIWGGLRVRFIKKLDGIIAYSHKGAQEYHQSGMPLERIFVAPNAAVPRPSEHMPMRKAEIGRANLLFVGRLQARKRLDLLFEACAGLPQHLQPSITIVGDGPGRDQFERDAARLYPGALFLGAKHGPELGELFDAADLFVLPGTGGLAVQQALAHALPVIVAEGDGTQDAMVTPANGWTVKPNSAAALRDVLREALGDVARLRRMGAESFRIAQEETNLERMVDVFISAANSVTYP